MRNVSKIIGGILTGFLLAIAPGQAAPAVAAATVYVNDYPGNDGDIRCPSTPYTTIQDGIDRAISINARTVIVCQGNLYFTGGSVSLVTTGLKVKSLGEVLVRPYLPFDGVLFRAEQSKNVVFDGFIIEGGSNVAGAQAFAFVDASGAVTHNTVMHWRVPAPTSGGMQMNIGVLISNTTSLAVKVDHNTFADMSNAAIQVTSPGRVTISHNRIQSNALWFNNLDLLIANYTPTGIRLQGTNGARVLKNTIQGDGLLHHGGGQTAIYLDESSSNQIIGNTINGTRDGILLTSSCGLSGHTDTNTIRANMVNGTTFGIKAFAYCGHIDNNKITSNKVMSIGSSDLEVNEYSQYGIELLAGADSVVVTGNLVKSNTVGGYYAANGEFYGIRLHAGASGATVIGNLVMSNKVGGYYGAKSVSVVDGNTATRNTILFVPPPGI